MDCHQEQTTRKLRLMVFFKITLDKMQYAMNTITTVPQSPYFFENTFQWNRIFLQSYKN